MKKLLSVLLSLLLVMSATACSSKDEAEVAQDNTAAGEVMTEGEELSGTFTYWSCFSGDSMTWDQQRVDNYMKEFPNIKVDVQFVTDSAGINNGKLLAAIAGGTAPDLIIADDYSSAYAFAAQGSFESWEPYMDYVGLDLDEFIEGYKDVIFYDGTPYLLPQDGNALMLYYNPVLFEEAGLDPNQPPTTLDELDRMAELLTVQNDDGSYERFGYIPWVDHGGESFTWPFYFGSDLYDVETGKLTITDKPVIDSLNWMGSYAEKYGSENIQAFVSGAGGMFSPDHPFMQGKVAMTITGNWFTNALKIYAPDAPYKVAAIPVPEGGRENSTTLGANVFAIPKGAENAKLAAHFVQYCLRPEVNATNFDVWRSVPTIDKSFDEVSWTKQGDEIYALERKLINSPKSGLPALSSVSSQLNVDLRSIRDAVIYDGADPLPLLEELQEKLQEEIDGKK